MSHQSLYHIDLPTSSRQSMSKPVIDKNSDKNSTEAYVKGIQISNNQIPHGVYDNRRPNSPTASDMQFDI